MKNFITSFILLVTGSLASTAVFADCRYETALEKGQVLKTINAQKTKISSLSKSEKLMVAETVNWGSSLESKISAAAAYRNFSRDRDSEITYFKTKEGQILAKVSWYPGDNPYGNFFKIETLDGKPDTTMVAAYQDGDFTFCGY